MALTTQNFGNQFDETVTQDAILAPGAENNNLSSATPTTKKSRSQAKSLHFDSNETPEAASLADTDLNLSLIHI